MLKSITLQNFRNYEKTEFKFSGKTTLIIGENTAGKTNLIEAIYFLATGKSFKTDRDSEIIKFGEKVARVTGQINPSTSLGVKKLEVVIAITEAIRPLKRYLVNGVSKRRVDFAENFSAVIFSPEDLDIIALSPSLRRRFLDEILEQTDRDYRAALTSYSKALRQRNALLQIVQETGKRSERQFEYWDDILIENGQLITKKREELINFLNTESKEIFACVLNYDKSVISKDRLLQYQAGEVGAGITLVGPHRDDFLVKMLNAEDSTAHELKFFGSRGQERLAVLQLKFLELSYIEKRLGQRPILILDDVFSELDERHIDLVLDEIPKQQTIITTTHKEFISKRFLKEVAIIELKDGRI
jgi:DNA replication and repair protein RecF